MPRDAGIPQNLTTRVMMMTVKREGKGKWKGREKRRLLTMAAKVAV